MKTKIVNKCVGALLALFAISACEKDDERLYLSGLEENELTATASSVVLSQDNSPQIVLSLVWKESYLAVSNSDKPAPNVLATYLQISKQNEFATFVETQEKNLSKAYTGAEVNAIAKNLGVEPGVSTPLYFRIRSSMGSNVESVFSNVVTVNVTPYQINMSVGRVLDNEKVETEVTLASPQSDGIYTGFMAAIAWQGFFLLEGNGTIWGNTRENDGKAFHISSVDTSWNFWFPGTAGCYYVEINTIADVPQWSALSIPALTVSGDGDIAGEMTFDRTKVQWTKTFTATSTSPLKVRLSANGKQYNATTGTDDALAIDTSLAFAENDSGTLRLAEQAGDITITVPEAGEYTLVVDLSNPNKWTCCAVSGSVAPPPTVNQYVYLPGIGDGDGDGSWTFNAKLSLYNEEELAYAGVVNVNSAGGYTINIEEDNWDDKYTFADGDTLSGTLTFKGKDNLPAPTAAGLYLVETSLKDSTYNLTPVANQIYVVGLHDSWTFDVPLTATATPGVFFGDITINSASQWGFQILPILPIDDIWIHYGYGGTEGKLNYEGAKNITNITDDASLTPGTYQMTVDLINETYAITPK
jgi:hypothetical protein